MAAVDQTLTVESIVSNCQYIELAGTAGDKAKQYIIIFNMGVNSE